MTKLCVGYDGRDSRIANRKDLTLDQVRPISAEWSLKLGAASVLASGPLHPLPLAIGFVKKHGSSAADV